MQHPPDKIIAELWRRGVLEWLLKPCQVAMLGAIQASQRFKYVIKCARRLGKTYLLCTLAIMTCLLKPGAQVRYAAPTAKALKKVIRPIMNKILRTCPEHLRPVFRGSEGMYLFPNGSEIHLAGVNNGRSDDLRGPACDLFIVDEARDIDELHYLVHDVAMPQFLDPDGNIVKGRRLVIASSPANSPGHDFTLMAQEAEEGGYYSHYTIFDGGYPIDVIRMFLEEDGVSAEDIDSLLAGQYTEIESTTVRREYLAEDVIDEDEAIIGSWRPFHVYEREATEFDKFYHRYIWMDIGVKRDLTVLLFAFYDFKKASVYVEDEAVIKASKLTTDIIAEAIKEKFKERPEYAASYRNIADNSHGLLINDLSQDHEIHFTETDKGKLHEMVNKLKNWVKSERFGIHPRCHHTVGAFKCGVWDKHKKDFARSKVYGHYDAIAAAVYGVRNVDEQSDPIPQHFGRTIDSSLWTPPNFKKPRLSDLGQDMTALFGKPKGK